MLNRRRLTTGIGLLLAALAAPAAVADHGLSEWHIVFPQDAKSTEFGSTFGLRKPGGRGHEGNDLTAPKMSPVYAAADGVVTHIDTSPTAGNYLIIHHTDGWSTWYIHLNNDTPGTDDGAATRDQVVVEGITEGSFVTAGQHIAYVGDSGNAEGTMPHTHFELHFEGNPIDPYDYLVQAHERALIVARLELLNSLDSVG